MMSTATAAIAWGLWVAWGSYDELKARKQLAAIRHRILCGGIRGKSSLTRLVHTGLRAAGIEALGRVTGGEPRLLLSNGEEIPHPRRGPANIREVRTLLRSARAIGIDAIVVENMAIRPELQRVIARRFVRPTLQLIGCDGPDHLEVLPSEAPSRAAAMLEGLDPAAPVLLAGYEENEPLETLAKRKGIEATRAPNRSLPGIRPHFVPLLSCAIAAMQRLGAFTREAEDAMTQQARDIQKLTVYRVGESAWVDLLSANDPLSSRRLIDSVLSMEEAKGYERPLLLYNHRSDRPRRLRSFEPLFREFESAICGSRVSRARASKLGAAWLPDPSAEFTKGPNLVFLTGNTGAGGGQLREALAARGSTEQW